VAATNGYAAIASFSNFGTKMVDVAAPGVGIFSAVPGGEHLYLSGTSQAAPFVAKIAGQILDVNPKLKPAEVRQILMGTSDLKPFLLDKVASGGIVNGSRAYQAAKGSLTMPIADAISRSLREVRDTEDGSENASVLSADEGFVIPLRSLF
jgi:cell wall-associated protease